MALGKKRGAIGKWSGGEMHIKEVNPDGTDKTTPDTFESLGFIEQGKVTDNTETEDYPDETGAIVTTNENSRTVKIEALLMQSDKETLDFLSEGCRGKYYALYRYEGIVDGKHQEIFFGIVRITPNIELAAGTKRPPFTATAYETTADITIAVAGLPTGAKAGAEVKILAGKFYTIVETAVV